MRSTARSMALLLSMFLVTTAEDCITVNDDALISVDIQNVTGTYPITAGTTSFNNQNDCVTKNPADYIDQDLAEIVAARLVDVTVQSIGTFSGNVNSGAVTVNGATLISYSGSWAAFNTAQSLLTSQLIQRNQAGVDALNTAIRNGNPIRVCASGAFSQPSVAGMSVRIEVFAQADAEPS
jgi:hypothetical protein